MRISPPTAASNITRRLMNTISCGARTAGRAAVTRQNAQGRQDRRSRAGAIPTVCDVCYQHRGRLPEKQIARAESHATMLRERLAACRASETRAREDLATARERVHAALASRGALADRLVEAAESDRKHNCPAQQLAIDPQIAEFARRHRARQDRWGPGEF